MHPSTRRILVAATSSAALLSACNSTSSNSATTQYTLGGNIIGLTNTGLTLADGVAPTAKQLLWNAVPPAGTSTPFSFNEMVPYLSAGTAYNVTVVAQPTANLCSVANGSGIANSNVSNIAVTCGSPSATVAVSAAAYNSATGTPSVAIPESIAADANGNLYIADRITGLLLKRAANGTFGTMALTNAANGQTISNPNVQQVAVDPTGNLYIAANPSGNGAVIQKVAASGAVTTLAGSSFTGATDGTGTAASFSNWIKGLAVDANDNAYVADANNNKIRKVTATGVTTTLAGSGATGATNGTGNAASFNMGGAEGEMITLDPSGNVYLVEWINADVRMITPSGVVTTFAGGSGRFGGTDGPGATTASFANPFGIASDARGYLYVLDGSNNIRLILPNGMVSTLVPSGTSVYDSNGNLINSGTMPLTALAAQPNGTLYTGIQASAGATSTSVQQIVFK